MRIHYLQHVAFEDPAALLPMLLASGHTVSGSHLYCNDGLPEPECFDGLVVMGGPMGVHDHAQYPWLADEIACIRAAIEAGKPLLGICLGAQLIAAALDARVQSGAVREIGWYPVARSTEAAGGWSGRVFPGTFEALHWHRDRFDIPAGAIPLGTSPACDRQGFLYRERVVALQFHLEVTHQSLAALINHCGDELDGSAWVQTSEQMLADPARFASAHAILQRLADQLFRSG